MSKVIRVIAVALIVMVLLIPATASVQADLQSNGSQVWYLSYEGTDWVGRMVPKASDVEGGVFDNISANILFGSDAATGPVTFLAGDWTVTADLEGSTAKYAVVGMAYNDSNGVHFLGQSDWIWQSINASGRNTFIFHNVPSFTLPPGNNIELFISGTSDEVAGQSISYNEIPANIKLTIDENHPGYNQLQSSPTSSGAPLPELPAAALLGVGLLGIGGFVYSRRKALDTGA